jgi:hypothetical protein
VIRAHWLRRVNDECEKARITCSPALADSSVGCDYFVDEFGATGALVVWSNWDLGVCVRSETDERFECAIDFEAILLEKSTSHPRSASLPVAAASSEPRRRARELEPLSPDRFGVHFTADAELRDLIERARALASHRLLQ